MTFLIHLLQSNVDLSSADLSTPRGAIAHLGDLHYAGADENMRKKAASIYPKYIQILDAGKFSQDQVELLHRIAREGCEATHEILELLKLECREEPVEKKAVELETIVSRCGGLLVGIALGSMSVEETKDTLDFLEAAKKKRRKKDG